MKGLGSRRKLAAGREKMSASGRFKLFRKIRCRTKASEKQEQKVPALGYETVFNICVTVFGKNAANPVKCRMVTLPESFYMDNLEEMQNKNHKKYLQFW